MKLFFLTWVWVLLVIVGVLLIFGAGAAAIHEGYAADAEGRGGNLMSGFVLGVLGLAAIVIGSVAQSRRNRRYKDVTGQSSATADRGDGD